MIGNKFADKITKVIRNSLQNRSETAESEIEDTGFVKEMPKVRYLSPDKKTENY